MVVNGLEEEFAGEVAVVRLQVETLDVIQLQEAYGGRGHPFFAVIDGEGQYFSRMAL
jgi:hypothetical protein